MVLIDILFDVIRIVLDVAWWVIILSAVMSWLIAFDVINLRNRMIYSFWESLNRITEPMYRSVRRYLPNTGALDFAPLVILILITIMQSSVLPRLQLALHHSV